MIFGMNIQPPHLMADTRALSTRMALAANVALSGAVGGAGPGDIEDSDSEQQFLQGQSSPGSQQSNNSKSFTSGANHHRGSMEDNSYVSRRKRLRSDDDDEIDEEDDLEPNDSATLEGSAPEFGNMSSEEEEPIIAKAPIINSKRYRNESTKSSSRSRHQDTNGHMSNDDLTGSPLGSSPPPSHLSHSRKMGNGANSVRTREHVKDRSTKRSTMDEVLKRLNKAKNHRSSHQHALHELDIKSEFLSQHRQEEKLNGNSKASKMDLSAAFPFDLSALSSLAAGAGTGTEARNIEETEQQLSSLIDQLQMVRQKLVAQQQQSVSVYSDALFLSPHSPTDTITARLANNRSPYSRTQLAAAQHQQSHQRALSGVYCVLQTCLLPTPHRSRLSLSFSLATDYIARDNGSVLPYEQ